MRTSNSQFQLMVEYMERNGDLNKFAEGPSGRGNCSKKWQELVNMLNIDRSGDVKPIDKWKRVWSDFKNNTKRKAAKIHKAAAGTDGEPASACKLTLTELEERVINIIGPPAATGLNEIKEIGVEASTTTSLGPLLSPLINNLCTMYKVEHGYHSPNSSQEQNCTSENSQQVDHHQQVPCKSERVDCSTAHRVTSRRRSARGLPRARGIQRSSARRHDATWQRFEASDERWRTLFSELATEHLRLTELQLQQQARWQDLFEKCLDVVSTHFSNR